MSGRATPSKTPRTLVHSYLDASRTHTQKVVRNRFQGLVRTPEPASSGRVIQHDRVATLQGRRRSQSIHSEGDETPRQMIEGFMEGLDSTVPLMRVKRRTSQSGISASQPVSSSHRGRNSVPANTSLDLDTDTPRTLMQKYLLNTTATVGTPVQRSLPSPDIPQRSPSYNTPSPFRESSSGSDRNQAMSASGRKTPRSMRRGYNLSQVDDHNMSEASVIPPSQPADFEMPSMFESSGSEADESMRSQQQQRAHRQNWTRRHGIKVAEIVPNTQNQRSNSFSRSQGHSFRADLATSHIDETHMDTTENNDNTGYYNVRDDRDVQDENRAPEANASQYNQYDDEETREQFRDAQHRKPSRSSFLSEYMVPLKDSSVTGGIDQLDSNESHVSESSFNSFQASHNRSMPVSEIMSPVIEFQTSLLRRGSSNGNESRRSVGPANSIHMEGSYTEVDGGRDYQRMGRYSEGHRSRIASMSPVHRDGMRRSEGHYRGERSIPVEDNRDLSRSTAEREHLTRHGESIHEDSLSDHNSPLSHSRRRYSSGESDRSSTRGQSNMSRSQSQGQRSTVNVSNIPYDRSPIGQGHTDMQRSRRSMPGQQIQERLKVSPRSRSYQQGYADAIDSEEQEQLFASRVETSHRDEGYDDRVEDSYEDEVMTPVDQDPVTPDQASPLHAVTPSPVISPQASPSSLTPRGSRQRSRSSNSLMSKGRSMQSGRSAMNVVNVSSRDRSRSPETRSSQEFASARSISRQSRYSGTPGSSPDRASSHARSPLKALTSDQAYTPRSSVQSPRSTVNTPAVTPRHNDMSRHAGTPSPAHTPNQFRTPTVREQRAGQYNQERITPRRVSMPLEVMASPRSQITTPAQASPVVAKKKHGSVAMLPNQTAMFSPPFSSTQNLAPIFRRTPRSANQSNASMLRAIDTTSHPSDINDQVPSASTLEKENVSDQEMEVEEMPASVPEKTASPAKPRVKKVVRKARKKETYTVPSTLVRKHFNHFAGMRVEKDALEEIMQVSEKYWDNLCKDLEAYAKHAGRKRINMDDFELLFKRQGFVKNRQELNVLIRKYLPWEEADKLIHVVRAFNRIEPPL